MVYFPRFWGGLPFPPSHLVKMSDELHMGKEPKHHPPPETIKRFYTDPGPQKPPPSDVRRLFDSTPPPQPSSFTKVFMRGVDDTLVRLALLQALQDKTDVNYDVVKFIHHVLKFTPEDIPERAEGYTLSEQGCKSYANGTWHKLDTPHQQVYEGERASCHAFQEIVRDLARQLQPTAEDTRSFPAVLQFLHDHVVEGDFASYMPDFGYGQAADGHKWAFLGAFGEMKKTQHSRCPSPLERTITMAQIGQTREQNKQECLTGPVTQEEQTEPPKPPKASKSLNSLQSRHTMATRAGAKKRPASLAEPASQRTGTKRKAAAEFTVGIAKRPKMREAVPTLDHHQRALVDFNDTELQMAKYMNELLSHGIRAYAFGFLVQETCMTLWYADRMGLATSASFDMFLEPELLLLLTAALHFANRHQLGVIPLIKYPNGASPAHDNAVLELPSATNVDGKAMKTPLSFALRVKDESPLIVAHGAIGRGTTVVPITATGRAETLFGKEKLVAKLSWPSVHRRSEADIIRVIRKKLSKHRTGKKYLKNVVDLKCSLDMSGMEIGLPRAFMDLSEPFEARLLRTLVMKEYLPLESIRSLDEFKTVFKHVFEAHHWVFEVVGILHQDPSLNNFLFYYDKAGNVVGVLADWDVASSKEDLANMLDAIEEAYRSDGALTSDSESHAGGQADNSQHRNEDSERRPRYRTGTGPFMALDLLATTKMVHRYRHDLESFFYILCYFCAQFRPATTENPKAYFAYLPGWESGTASEVYQAKYAFLENHDGAFNDLFTHADKTFLPLSEEWIYPLWKGMFIRVTSLSRKMESSYGLLTLRNKREDSEWVEEYIGKYRRAAKKADCLFVYENFKKVLFD